MGTCEIAAVDASLDPDFKGQVAVFTLVESVVPLLIYWAQAGSTLVGDPGEGFGYSLSISDDGMVLAVGSDVPDLVEASNNIYAEGNSPEGFVRVFKYISADDTWTQLGDKIEATSASRNLDSCSISGDGFGVAVFDQAVGFPQVYKTNTLDASSGSAQWTLVGDPVETYGEPVLSYDGTVMAAGNAVFELTRDSQWRQVLYVDGVLGRASISSNGTRVAIASHTSDPKVHIFQRNPRSLEWDVLDRIDTDTTWYVKLSSDGSRVTFVDEYVALQVYDVGGCDYSNVPSAERGDPPSCAAGEIQIWGSTNVECAAGALFRACRPWYSWGDETFCPVWAEHFRCGFNGNCGYEYDGDYSDADGSLFFDFERELSADGRSQVVTGALDCGGNGETACTAKAECSYENNDNGGYCRMTADAFKQAMIADGAPGSFVAYYYAVMSSNADTKTELTALRVSCGDYVDFSSWSNEYGGFWEDLSPPPLPLPPPAVSQVNIDTDSLCYALHEFVECRASGECGPYSYALSDSDNGRTEPTLSLQYVFDNKPAYPSGVQEMIDKCYDITDAALCNANSRCVFVDAYSNCNPKSAEVVKGIEADGASAGYVAFASIFWNECWQMDASACSASSKCSVDEGINECYLTAAMEVAISAAACRMYESFDDVAGTYGVELTGTIATHYPGACVAVSVPANGKQGFHAFFYKWGHEHHNSSCDFMLTGDECTAECDAGYVRALGNSTFTCVNGVYTPATCRTPYSWGDAAFCPAWEKAVTCEAVEECELFSTAQFGSDYALAGYVTEMHEHTGDLSATSSAYDRARNECNSLINGTLEDRGAAQCRTNVNCMWYLWGVEGDMIGWCDPKTNVVLEAVTSDDAPSGFVAFMSLYWHECVFLDAETCVGDARCQSMPASYDYRCAPSNETSFKTAAAACGERANFAGMQAAYGFSYPGRSGCQNTCEGWHVPQTTCQSTTHCDWFVDRCLSSVQAAACPSSNSSNTDDASSSPPPTQADVDAAKSAAGEKRVAADAKRASAEAKRDELLGTIGNVAERRMAEVFANAALSGVSTIAKVSIEWVEASGAATACDEAFSVMGISPNAGACAAAASSSSRRRLLASFDVSVFLDPSQVDAVTLDAAVANLSSRGFAPRTFTADPVAELSRIDGVDQTMVSSFKLAAAEAVTAEADAVKAEETFRVAEESLDAAGVVEPADGASSVRAPPPSPPSPPPPNILISDYDSSGGCATTRVYHSVMFAALALVLVAR